MMQGEVTIESFPSYPRRRAINKQQNNLLALSFCDLLAVSEVFIQVAIGWRNCLARRKLTAVAERGQAQWVKRSYQMK